MKEPENLHQSRDDIDSIFNIGITLIVALILYLSNSVLQVISFRTVDWYAQPGIIKAYFKTALDYPSWVVIPAVLLVIALFSYLLVTMSWRRATTKSIKWFILLVALILVWRTSTYPVNFLANQSHELDRLLMLSFCCLAVWRPVFILPIPLLAHIVLWQFHSEIGAQSLAQPSMALKLLLLFSILLILTAVTRRKYTTQFILLAAVVVLAHYWAPGFGKLKLGWHEFGQVHYMLAASYANGWLHFIDKETIATVLQFFSRLNPAIVLTTLLLETLVIVALCHSLLLRMLLILAVLFHLGVFVASGIFFWQWIIIDLALIFLMYRSEVKYLYLELVSSPRLKVLSVALIALTPLWLNPVQLAWHDSPVSYTYRITAFGKSGEQEALMPTYFSPYEYPFTQSTFAYLPTTKSLPITWGATLSLKMVQELKAAQSVAEVEKIIDRYGVVSFDAERAEKFDHFIETYTTNKQNAGEVTPWFNAVRAPTMLWTRGYIQPPVKFRISRVEVKRVITWFDGIRLREIDVDVVRTIEL